MTLSVSLIEFKKSDKKDKKYKISFVLLGKIHTFHFGSKNSQTFSEGASLKKRNAYLKRFVKASKGEWGYTPYSVNEDWSRINPGSLSAFLLWNTPDMNENLRIYLKLFNIKDKR
jgi:hypothetical protein